MIDVKKYLEKEPILSIEDEINHNMLDAMNMCRSLSPRNQFDNADDIKIVDEIIANICKLIKISKNDIVYDFAVGRGTIPFRWHHRLFNFELKDQITDPIERHSHIIKNMLVGYDIEPAFTKLLSRYLYNINQANPLEINFKNMEANNFNKIGVTNPPWNTPRGTDGRRTGDLFPDFTEMTANTCDISAQIIPAKCLNKYILRNYRKKLKKWGLKYVKIFVKNDPFKGKIALSGETCYIILEKGYTGPVTLEDDNGNSVTRYFKDVISFDDEERNNKILKSIRSKNLPSISSIWFRNEEIRKSDLNFDETNGVDIITKNGTEKIILSNKIKNVECHIDTYRNYFSSSTSKWKTGYGKTGIAQPGTYIFYSYCYMPHSSNEEAINCKHYLSLYPILFLKKLNHFDINFTKQCFKYIPLVDFKIKWTVKKIQKEFNISNEDLLYMKQKVKEWNKK